MKMNLFKKIILFTALILSVTSCGLDDTEPYNLKYIHIMMDEVSSTNVSAKAKVVGVYNVYLSSEAFTESVEVSYKIEVGDGLKEGVDFNMITTGDKLVFLPGVFEMPIRIQWLPNINLDPEKNNTLKIVLLSNNRGYSIGLPGPDHNQSSFTIIKKIQ
ncbi:MAG: hypothetical protein H6Q20_2234 [Bacteroidetes bacterium]|jgi:hypothetical protein|nr:hypothetical protein [Bacteroidota bacterium]